MTIHQRSIHRDNMMLVADILVEGALTAKRFRVRNLSPGGMLAKGDGVLPNEARVTIKLRNIGAVQGRIIWAEEGRYGIAFDRQIDPHAVRAPTALGDFLDRTARLRIRPK